jgi:hypothetical protein
MTRSLKQLLVMPFLIMLSILWLNAGFAKDIRDQVINETSLDEHIVIFCLQYCQGNERKGYLKGLTIDRMDNSYYHVLGRAALQNRHVIRSLDDFVIYDHTVIIKASGRLNATNCELRIDNVIVENDFQDIFTTLLQNQGNLIGRVERIPNCRRFLE